MRNHPANKDRQVQAVIDAGHDPQVGTWPGDVGFDGDGSVGGAALLEGVLSEDERTALLILHLSKWMPDAKSVATLRERGLVGEFGRLTDRGALVARRLAREAGE